MKRNLSQAPLPSESAGFVPAGIFLVGEDPCGSLFQIKCIIAVGVWISSAKRIAPAEDNRSINRLFRALAIHAQEDDSSAGGGVSSLLSPSLNVGKPECVLAFDRVSSELITSFVPSLYICESHKSLPINHFIIIARIIEPNLPMPAVSGKEQTAHRILLCFWRCRASDADPLVHNCLTVQSQILITKFSRVFFAFPRKCALMQSPDRKCLFALFFFQFNPFWRKSDDVLTAL